MPEWGNCAVGLDAGRWSTDRVRSLLTSPAPAGALVLGARARPDDVAGHHVPAAGALDAALAALRPS
jgi:hypothetical protein